MAMQTGKYAADAILNVQRGIAFPAVPTNFYLAALTTLPTKNDGTGMVEVPTLNTGYARYVLAPVAGTYSAPTTQADNVTEKIASAADSNFVVNTGSVNWGIIVGVAIFDAATGGNLWYYGPLNAAVTINVGNQLQVPATDLTVQQQ